MGMIKNWVQRRAAKMAFAWLFHFSNIVPVTNEEYETVVDALDVLRKYQ